MPWPWALATADVQGAAMQHYSDCTEAMLLQMQCLPSIWLPVMLSTRSWLLGGSGSRPPVSALPPSRSSCSADADPTQEGTLPDSLLNSITHSLAGSRLPGWLQYWSA